MATKVKRRIVEKVKPDYTRNKSGCVVYTIECVLQHDVAAVEESGIGEALGQLQQFGAAEIVQVDHVQEPWDAACKILRQRMLQ